MLDTCTAYMLCITFIQVYTLMFIKKAPVAGILEHFLEHPVVVIHEGAYI